MLKIVPSYQSDMQPDPLFWEDRWLHGTRIQEFAPGIYNRVAKRVKATQTVYEAITLGSWIRDIGPDMAYERVFDKKLPH